MNKVTTVPYFLFIILCIISTTAYSQSPTKEQTIDFLKSYYEGKGKMSCEELSYPHQTSNSFKLISIKDLGNCEYEIKWEWDYNYYYAKDHSKDYSYRRLTTIVNFSKIEELGYFTSKRGDCNLYYINVKGAPGVKFAVTEESLSYGKNETKTYSESKVMLPANNQYDAPGKIFEETEKIYKAFNHLRKLCGAPDPIKF
jgi:hypothetical protein